MTNPQLWRVMAYYSVTPTDNLISDTLILTRDSHNAESWAAAAVLGFSRGKFYIDTARSLMDQIMTEAVDIAWHSQACEDLVSSLPKIQVGSQLGQLTARTASKFKVSAHALSVHAEVLWHFYASSLQHAWYFLTNCVSIIDPHFQPHHDATRQMAIIQAFRNHMEHRDKATKNLDSKDWLSMSTKNKKSVTVGYARDHRNNITFIPLQGQLAGQKQRMPINPEGFQRFESIILPVYEHLERSCREQLLDYFTRHPEQTPELEDVGSTLTERMYPVAEH